MINSPDTHQESHPMHEMNKDVAEVAAEVDRIWNEIVAKPEAVISNTEFSNMTFVAGAGLAKEFGDEKSEVWQMVKAKAAKEEQITIAGVTLTLEQMTQIGEYYRTVGGDNHCIDERLAEGNEQTKHLCTHDECGACKALKDAVKTDKDIAQMVRSRKGETAAQPLRAGMEEHHSSLAIYISLGKDGKGVSEAARNELQKKGALPFHVTLALEKIHAFCQDKRYDEAAFIRTLMSWNVQIARNIIGGHNTLSGAADKSFIVLDARDVKEENKSSIGIVKTIAESIQPKLKMIA